VSRIREVTGSNLSPKTGYMDRGLLRLASVPAGKCGVLPRIKLASFHIIHKYVSITRSVDTVPVLIFRISTPAHRRPFYISQMGLRRNSKYFLTKHL